MTGLHWHLITSNSQFDQLARLEYQVYPADDCITGEQYREWHDTGNVIWLLTDDRENWIANFQVESDATNSDANSLCVTGVAVFLNYQGKGYGHEAMSCLLTKYGHQHLVCRVRQENLRSLSLIKQYGFAFQQTENRQGIIWEWYERKPVGIEP